MFIGLEFVVFIVRFFGCSWIYLFWEGVEYTEYRDLLDKRDL